MDSSLFQSATSCRIHGQTALQGQLKENATIVVVPSTVLETMQLGGIAGVTALTMGLGQERTNKEKENETIK